MSNITIKQAANLSDAELLLHLHQEWNIQDTTSIEVIGVMSATYSTGLKNYFYRIHHVKLQNEYLLEYPILDLKSEDTIKESGIYVANSFSASKSVKEYINAGGSVKIKCKLILSSVKERQKHNNPFLLQADPKTVQVLTEIKEGILVQDSNGSILVPDSITKYYKEINKKTIEEETKGLKEEYEKTKENLEKSLLEKERILEEEMVHLKSEFDEKQNSIKTLQEKYTQQLENNTNKQTEFEEIVSQIKQEKENKLAIENQIKELKINLEREEELMSKKLEKFRSFVKDQADTLLNLEFIDKKEYKELLMITDEVDNEEVFINFHEDLDSDFSKAISHIQAYLFNQDIMYPRYIIEDFLALIQTNDLIILAGESGSGKTNLIKSFAKAVGGKSFIIPVKPNWTSSEDLLGYYNPLEKKYLTTPFLEALLEANKNPDIPYFICLDEMNLARVEYYFADFLSLLEERGDVQPKIPLYSDDESSHVLSEFKNVLSLIKSSKEKFKKNNIVNFVEILQDEEINEELKRVFGFSDKDSLIKYHSDLRRMLTGILNTPSSITFPKNVRIIGAINIDETTHYLSPKILDRAHIMKFDSPLLFDWESITKEVEGKENIENKLKFEIEDFGSRRAYPRFDPKNLFSETVVKFTKEYFTPLGIEVGLRTIRQGLNYLDIFLKLNDNNELALNNFIIHKILPKMTFDGGKKVGEGDKKDLLLSFRMALKDYISEESIEGEGIYAIEEIDEIIEKAESNDWIVNYWA